MSRKYFSLALAHYFQMWWDGILPYLISLEMRSKWVYTIGEALSLNGTHLFYRLWNLANQMCLSIGICWLNISAWTLSSVLPQTFINCSGALVSVAAVCWFPPWRCFNQATLSWRAKCWWVEKEPTNFAGPFWALTVSWFVAWDKALNLCVSKNKWWILSHLHCLLADASCTWWLPCSLNLRCQLHDIWRRIACRASEEVLLNASTGDSGCWWNSLDFWVQLPGEYTGKVSPIYRGVWEKAVKVEQESGTLPKLNLPDFTIAKPLIRIQIGSKSTSSSDLWWITGD